IVARPGGSSMSNLRRRYRGKTSIFLRLRRSTEVGRRVLTPPRGRPATGAARTPRPWSLDIFPVEFEPVKSLRDLFAGNVKLQSAVNTAPCLLASSSFGVMQDGAFRFAFGLALFQFLPFVVLSFPFADAEQDFYLAVFPEEGERDEGVAFHGRQVEE